MTTKPETRSSAAILKTARAVLKTEAEAVAALAGKLGPSFAEAVNAILKSKGRVIVTGVGKSGLVGRKIAATLASTGTPSLFIYPVECLHGDLGMFAKGDMALALSYSGETEELVKVVPLIQAMNIPVIAMTGRPDSRLGRMADITVAAPVRKEACPYNITPTASTTAMLALGDAMSVALMEMRDFTREDFARFHPGGSLGKRLAAGKMLEVPVRELMHSGKDNPVVKSDALVSEALLVMTATHFGATSVVDKKGKLCGFFTDGDLRRALQSDPNAVSSRVSDVMMKTPTTVTPQDKAASAARIIKRLRIDNLPVVDSKGRPVGLLDAQDLIDIIQLLDEEA